MKVDAQGINYINYFNDIFYDKINNNNNFNLL